MKTRTKRLATSVSALLVALLALAGAPSGAQGTQQFECSDVAFCIGGCYNDCDEVDCAMDCAHGACLGGLDRVVCQDD